MPIFKCVQGHIVGGDPDAKCKVCAGNYSEVWRFPGLDVVKALDKTWDLSALRTKLRENRDR